MSVGDQVTSLWFVPTAEYLEKYFRWLIGNYAQRPQDIEQFAPHAFKALQFVDECFRSIGTMNGAWPELLREIVKHLSIFSDDGQRIFSGRWSRAPVEFGSLGINLSDENGNTKANPLAKRERRIVVKGEELFFWWHSKLEPHQNRIHICPGKIPAGGKMIVGIFCLHLAT